MPGGTILVPISTTPPAALGLERVFYFDGQGATAPRAIVLVDDNRGASG